MRLSKVSFNTIGMPNSLMSLRTSSSKCSLTTWTIDQVFSKFKIILGWKALLQAKIRWSKLCIVLKASLLRKKSNIRARSSEPWRTSIRAGPSLRTSRTMLYFVSIQITCRHSPRAYTNWQEFTSFATPDGFLDAIAVERKRVTLISNWLTSPKAK